MAFTAKDLERLQAQLPDYPTELIGADRLPQPTESYAQLVPDLIVEVKSKPDSLDKLRQKIWEFIRLGSQVGVLVDPRTRTMEVYRLGIESVEDAQVLRDGDVLTLPELLPEWELAVAEVWAPVFE